MHRHQHPARRASIATPSPSSPDPSCLASLGAADAAADRVASESETARVASASRIEKHGTTDNRDSASSRAGEQVGVDQKRFVNQRALLALAGYALTRSNESDGAVTYFASRWGMVRALDNLIDVASFAARVGAGVAS